MSPATKWVSEAVAEFGSACKGKLAGPGDREAAIRTPLEELLTRFGERLHVKAVFHDEVRDPERRVRPDYPPRQHGRRHGAATNARRFGRVASRCCFRPTLRSEEILLAMVGDRGSRRRCLWFARIPIRGNDQELGRQKACCAIGVGAELRLRIASLDKINQQRLALQFTSPSIGLDDRLVTIRSSQMPCGNGNGRHVTGDPRRCISLGRLHRSLSLRGPLYGKTPLPARCGFWRHAGLCRSASRTSSPPTWDG